MIKEVLFSQYYSGAMLGIHKWVSNMLFTSMKFENLYVYKICFAAPIETLQKFFQVYLSRNWKNLIPILLSLPVPLTLIVFLKNI